MKATGIVRRIDDLGRVVIPKEIRRTMRIREGDPLEIYTDREGEVIFKKYSPIGELTSFASQYAETLHKTGGLVVAICDKDAVIAVSGVPKKEYIERRLSGEMDRIMSSRGTYVWHEDSERVTVTPEASGHFVSCAAPIVSEGDVIGCVVSLCENEARARTVAAADAEIKLIQTAAGFLGRQMEA